MMKIIPHMNMALLKKNAEKKLLLPPMQVSPILSDILQWCVIVLPRSLRKLLNMLYPTVLWSRIVVPGYKTAEIIMNPTNINRAKYTRCIDILRNLELYIN